MQSNVVAVPKSTTIAGTPYSRATARPFTSRSAPTSAGRSVLTGIGMIAALAESSGKPRRSAIVSMPLVRAGTTDASEIPVTSANEAPSRWSSPSISISSSSGVLADRVAARRLATMASPLTNPRATLVLPISSASSMAR